MKNVIKVLSITVFIVFTMIGLTYGADMGINYSHVKLALFALAMPFIFIVLWRGWRKQGASYFSPLRCLLILGLGAYLSVIGGGYVYLINTIGGHERLTISGKVVSKEQHYSQRYGGSYFVEIRDDDSGTTIKFESTSFVFNRLREHDQHTLTVSRGNLGLLYLRKH